jgi:hypothetical protein
MVANLQFVAEGFGQWTSTLLYIFWHGIWDGQALLLLHSHVESGL